jgi:hypothetical protein
MPTLEQIGFYECDHVTDAGRPFLAALPHLREVALEGCRCDAGGQQGVRAWGAGEVFDMIGLPVSSCQAERVQLAAGNWKLGLATDRCSRSSLAPASAA